MKKPLFILMILTAPFATRAADYGYLTFETTDGAKVSVSVSSLSITVSGTTLTAGSQSFTLSNLSRMYFSSTDETTGIESLKADAADGVCEYYTIDGCRVDNPQKGSVYIVKLRNGTSKIVRK